MKTALVPKNGVRDSKCKRVQQVILAGGSGTRLWPVSRETLPKQLVPDLYGNGSLLVAASNRLNRLAAAHVTEKILVVCAKEHRYIVQEQLSGAGKSFYLILEPCPKSTAPALTLAALASQREADDAILVAMPADHVIANEMALLAAVSVAIEYAALGKIVSLGIVPDRAETRYGYIRVGKAVNDPGNPCECLHMEEFIEKPTAEAAQHYVESGAYLWNSGILVLRADTWLNAVWKLEPEIARSCSSALCPRDNHSHCFEVSEQIFEQSPSNSIDYAVMERLGLETPGPQGVVVPLHCGWSDVGTWDAIWKSMDRDRNGNATRGRIVLEGARDTFAFSDDRLVACVGTENIAIVDTPDALLVTRLDRSNDVKLVVSRIRAAQGREAKRHRKVMRPWGILIPLIPATASA